MTALWRAGLCVIGLLAAGCETVSLPSLPGFGGSASGGARLDREAEAAFTAALERTLSNRGAEAETFAAGNASGSVVAGEATVIGVLNDSRAAVVAPGGLRVGYAMEIDQGPAATPGPVNIRLAPDRAGARVRQSGEGERFTVYGRLTEVDWLLVGEPGRVAGYLYAPLATELPGDLGQASVDGEALPVAGLAHAR
ncbi:MAG: hypothetical protein AAFR11_10095, partial [Pseudomonadota bacterium]